jgi:uncharacterized delta-60 repeat protein
MFYKSIKTNNMKKPTPLFLFATLLLLYLNTYAQDGQLDTTFHVGTGIPLSQSVPNIAFQSDNKIIISGYYTTYNGKPNYGIARLNTDGTLDTTFKIKFAKQSGNNGTAVVVQPDGKIIVCGDSVDKKYTNNSLVNYVARVHPDGTIDTSFHAGSTDDCINCQSITKAALQADGKVIIVGDFNYYNGNYAPGIARLNANGSFDPTFKVGAGVDDELFGVKIQNDGKILIGGRFRHYNNTARNKIVRLNTDGSLDPTFNIGTGAIGANDNALVADIIIQKDQKIVIGGSFTSYNGVSRNAIARLNTDGSLDTTFYVGTGSNTGWFSTSMQHDGKFIIGGGFTSYNGTAVNQIARLNTDGSLDPTFKPGTGPNAYISTTAIQNDGKVIINGGFTSYNGTNITRLARINYTSIITGNVDENVQEESSLHIFPNPNNGEFTIQYQKEESFGLINSLGQTVKTLHFTPGQDNRVNISSMGNGTYMLKSNSNPQLNYRILVTK